MELTPNGANKRRLNGLTILITIYENIEKPTSKDIERYMELQREVTFIYKQMNKNRKTFNKLITLATVIPIITTSILLYAKSIK